MNHVRTGLLAVAVVGHLAGCAAAADVRVTDSAGLRRALGTARPGTRILLAPGEYAGGLWFSQVHGTADQPITVQAADPQQPPIFRGGGQAMHLADTSWLVLDGLHVTGCTANGLNVDDAGSVDTPAHHLTLRNLVIRDVGPTGNRDGLKMSGVDDFRVEACTFESWGDAGSGIDLVGCHRGVITGCTFRQTRDRGSNGVQCKGGTSEVTIQSCTFDQPGSRAINVGGSTGLQYFRPLAQGYEAKAITVERCLFLGGQAPIAFVGCDGATVRFNTLVRPGRWALRILQETTDEGFVPCRNGAFTDNVVVFRSDAWAEGGVNIGPRTAPATFTFARNLWFCEDRPERSRPTLPSVEADGLYGQDPRFRDPAKGDYALQEGSPAAGRGHTAPAE